LVSVTKQNSARACAWPIITAVPTGATATGG
jgi:hypothetical protein